MNTIAAISIEKNDFFDWTSSLKEYAPEIYSDLLGEDLYFREEAIKSANLVLYNVNSDNIDKIKRFIEKYKDQPAILEKKLATAETVFIHKKENFNQHKNFLAIKKEYIETEVLRKMKTSIMRWNIIFVFVLIVALIFAAIYLPKDLLALISAIIGGTINHILTERTSLLNRADDHTEIRKPRL